MVRSSSFLLFRDPGSRGDSPAGSSFRPHGASSVTSVTQGAFYAGTITNRRTGYKNSWRVNTHP